MKNCLRLSGGVLLVTVLLGCARQPAGREAPPSEPSARAAPTAPTGERLTVAMIPKLKGIDYFNACEEGAKEAAAELGTIELIYEGPTEAKEEKQNELIDGFIAQGVDVIAIAANDPMAVAPYLKRAREAGIHVITWDADADPEKSGREFFVNQALPEAIARTLIDVLAKEAGEDAPIAIISSTATAPNQTEWLRHMRPYMKEAYPQMKEVAFKTPGEDMQEAFRQTQDVLKAHPEVRGIIGLSSVAFPGAADAVRQGGKSGQVAVTGLSTPKNMREFVHDGTVKTVVLWNPVELGYLTIYVAHAVAEGTLKPGDTSIEAGRLGAKEVKGDQVLLGPPMLFTRENIDQYDF